MEIFRAIKNFFCEEEVKEKTKYDPDDTPLINAADMFQVKIASNADFLSAAVARAKTDDEIKSRVQADLETEARRQKTELDQGKAAAAPAPSSETTRPNWQTVSDEL